MKTQILLLMVLLSCAGCAKQTAQEQMQITNQTIQPSASTQAQSEVDICIQACKDTLSTGKNLESGPCLLDPIKQNPSWVCDVAHSPRESVDNLPENQCQSYRSGAAKHFVEVSADCSFIKKA